jgi:hypothetical protein
MPQRRSKPTIRLGPIVEARRPIPQVGATAAAAECRPLLHRLFDCLAPVFNLGKVEDVVRRFVVAVLDTG